jgi:addiction module RelE/StbE family toxin
MDLYKVNLTEPAENDLRDIARYISYQLNAPTTALNMIQTIKAAIAKLETMAAVYPFVRDDRLAALGYRFLPIKNYIAFYIVDERAKTVDVDRILYGRRDWNNII